MKIKRFVSTILLLVLIALVPLEALSQLEPEITYGDWCRYLAELHAELHMQREAGALYLNLFFWGGFWGTLGTLALAAGMWFLYWADFEDYLADKYWSYVSKADEYRDTGFLWLVVGCAIWILYLTDVVPKAREIKALSGDRTIADILREIELWELAGAARMWFYPCK